jgi:hypothetical protein
MGDGVVLRMATFEIDDPVALVFMMEANYPSLHPPLRTWHMDSVSLLRLGRFGEHRLLSGRAAILGGLWAGGDEEVVPFRIRSELRV